MRARSCVALLLCAVVTSAVAQSQESTIGVLFLGDRFIEGWSEGAEKEIWNEYFGKHDPANFGVRGQRIEHLLGRIEKGEWQGISPKVVVLHIGAENLDRPADDIVQGVTKIVRQIHRRLPAARLLMLGLFPRGADPKDPDVAELRSKIRSVNRALAALDDGKKTRYLDVGDHFLYADEAIPNDIMPDGVNLTPAGYRLWAEAMAPLLDEMMAEKVEDPATVHVEMWPASQSAFPRNARIEQAVDELLRKMTVEEKVGQIIAASITDVTPDEAKRHHLGAVLRRGGSSSPAKDWLALADQYHEASTDTFLGGQPIPILLGTDAAHGHSRVVGATVFPHNIALGATRNYELIRLAGIITAAEMAITGVDWTLSPVLAVPGDDRWGRTHETFSEDPEIVRACAVKLIEGLQGSAGSPVFLGPGKVLATATDFVGAGATSGALTETELRDVHAAPYMHAIRAGVQTVMVSRSNWQGRRVLEHKSLLTDILKGRFAFDGIVVGESSGQALNAGVDLLVASADWQALHRNTIAQVRSGEVPMGRLDDAVRRILRVKIRAGLFRAGLPSRRPLAGKFELLGSVEHRAVARQAVRESLVLLKNHGVLPLRPHHHILVAGDGADNIARQCGESAPNAEFPGATSIWEGIRTAVEAAGGRATLSVDGSFVETPDAAVVVFGYENQGVLALLQSLREAGIPTVAVFLSGRPLLVNALLNASDAFVAAWFPGTEGNGVADVLFGTSGGQVRYHFRGKLSFSWPPLFPVGFGLTYKDDVKLPELPVEFSTSAR